MWPYRADHGHIPGYGLLTIEPPEHGRAVDADEAGERVRAQVLRGEECPELVRGHGKSPSVSAPRGAVDGDSEFFRRQIGDALVRDLAHVLARAARDQVLGQI